MDTVDRIRTAQQQAALVTLADLVARGLEAEVEPLLWRLDYNQAVGVVSRSAMDRDTPQAVFHQWVALLDATLATPETYDTGYTMMSAWREFGDGDDLHTVFIHLDLPPASAY